MKYSILSTVCFDHYQSPSGGEVEGRPYTGRLMPARCHAAACIAQTLRRVLGMVENRARHGIMTATVSYQPDQLGREGSMKGRVAKGPIRPRLRLTRGTNTMARVYSLRLRGYRQGRAPTQTLRCGVMEGPAKKVICG